MSARLVHHSNSDYATAVREAGATVSWLANTTESTDRRIELQEVAGWLLDSAAKKARIAAVSE